MKVTTKTILGILTAIFGALLDPTVQASVGAMLHSYPRASALFALLVAVALAVHNPKPMQQSNRQAGFSRFGTLVLILLLTSAVLLLVGCSPLAMQARDANAAAKGVLEAAQQKYGAACLANPYQVICQDINRAVYAQNALITATETYCGWSRANPPANTKASCQAVKSAAPALETAITNLNFLITEVRGAL
jgi:hypothetical protein